MRTALGTSYAGISFITKEFQPSVFGLSRFVRSTSATQRGPLEERLSPPFFDKVISALAKEERVFKDEKTRLRQRNHSLNDKAIIIVSIHLPQGQTRIIPYIDFLVQAVGVFLGLLEADLRSPYCPSPDLSSPRFPHIYLDARRS